MNENISHREAGPSAQEQIRLAVDGFVADLKGLITREIHNEILAAAEAKLDIGGKIPEKQAQNDYLTVAKLEMLVSDPSAKKTRGDQTKHRVVDLLQVVSNGKGGYKLEIKPGIEETLTSRLKEIAAKEGLPLKRSLRTPEAANFAKCEKQITTTAS